MTSPLRSACIAATLTLGVSVLVAPAPWGSTAAYAKKEKGPAFAPEAFINAAPIASGQLRRFLVNPRGEIDLLQMSDGTLVKFPPHMNASLLAEVKPGDTISVRGFRESAEVIKAVVIVNEATKQQVVEQPPVPDVTKMPKHLRFAALTRMQVSGTVERALRGKNGEVNGVLLTDGAVVRFPSHAAFDFAAALQPGQAFAAEGFGTENANGKGLEASRMGQNLATLRAIYGQ